MRGKKAKKNKPKYNQGAVGNFLNQYGKPLQQGAILAGSSIESLSDTSAGAGIGGALKGAGVGAAFGPIGAVGGAILGGVTGLVGMNKQKEEEEKLRDQQTSLNALQLKHNLVANSGRQLNKGGKLASKLNPLAGGGLVPVSKDAVEVVANNPGATDSVELESAFVDNNEIIDNQNRVFSDDLKLPSGRSIAKEAKRLEKMKGKGQRFSDANGMLDQKLDRLFKYQEGMKAPTGKKKGYFTGGEIPDDPLKKGVKAAGTNDKEPVFNTKAEFDNYYLQKSIEKLSPEDKQWYEDSLAGKVTNMRPEDIIALRAPTPSYADYIAGKGDVQPMGNVLGRAYGLAKGGKIKKVHGGFFDDPKKPLGMPGMPPNPGFDLQFEPGKIQPTDIGSGPTLNKPTNNTADILQKGVTAMATFAPNLISTNLQRRLKAPIAPQLESMTTLKKINPAAQLAGASRAYGQAKEVIGANTAQGSNLASATGNLLAKRLEAENQIHGQTQQMNIGIQNQEAALNQGAKARNTERMNRFNDDNVNFKNKKLQLTSENTANLSTKILQQGREKNQMIKDQQALEYLKAGYGDSGVLARLAKENPELAASVKKSLGLSKGGKLAKKSVTLKRLNKPTFLLKK